MMEERYFIYETFNVIELDTLYYIKTYFTISLTFDFIISTLLKIFVFVK